jgi:23S rRNA (uracil1939-C5)-methyltransferase
VSRRGKLPEEPFEIEIRALLENGRGVADYEGKKLEVHGALPGERVRARYLFGRRFRGQAETLEVLRSSPDRVEPRCPHFGTCSACSLQHVEQGAQLKFKQESMLAHLREQGAVAPELVLPPLSVTRWNYRRKARLSVRWVRARDRALVGFRERDGRFVTDMRECHVLDERVAIRLPALSELVTSLDARESIPQIEVSCGDDRCALVFRHLQPLSAGDMRALERFERQSGLAVLLQPKGPDSVTPLGPAPPVLGYSLPETGVSFEFEPLDFVQVNGELNRAMVGKALELLDPQPGDRLLDLFCGLGNFSLPLAGKCDGVTGVEGDAGLVARARRNAARNGLANVDFIMADLYEDTPRIPVSPSDFNKVLLDPPRSGAERVLPMVGEGAATRVLYVSCNPETLGRDAGLLVRSHGFRLACAGIMDMFPQTSHIESMALFERASGSATA